MFEEIINIVLDKLSDIEKYNVKLLLEEEKTGYFAKCIWIKSGNN